MPSGFWQTTAMRAVLDTRDLGKVMHAFRTHPYHGRVITQETAAGWVGMSQSRLSRTSRVGSSTTTPPGSCSGRMYWASHRSYCGSSTYTEAVGQQLLRTTARLQKLTGWLAFDAGQQAVARNCFTDAPALARQSGDAETETFALAQLAFQSITLGQPREGLRFAVTAEQAIASLREPSVLPAIPYLRQARASALVGDTHASDQAITQARTVLDRHGDEPTEEWLAFLNHSEIDRTEASCAMDLGRASRAEALLEPAVAGLGDRFARNRAAGHVQLARARLDRKEVDGAVEAAHAALDDLAGDVASWRVTSRLDAVAQSLTTDYPGVTGVDSFLDRHQVLNL